MRGKPTYGGYGQSFQGLIPAHAGKTAEAAYSRVKSWAHPRACGENSFFFRCLLRGVGSSPRMRGKPGGSLSHAETGRLIPAHAGKTTPQRWEHSQVRAHPRACGENTACLMGRRIPWGSSPRMRGKRCRLAIRRTKVGLIPAHAGKTLTPDAPCLWSEAHPRACGENCPEAVPVDNVLGSSPRMRGKLNGQFVSRNALGLIPAHAGKTMSSGVVFTAWGAHPRACGENGTTGSGLFLFRGSSPRMRGKQHLRIRDQLSNGLIPAHAGKTPYAVRQHEELGAHPRACGENFTLSRPRLISSGSSPRMRGKRVKPSNTAGESGLIPAHAGKTLIAALPTIIQKAHPRACGENVFHDVPPFLPEGSSPRMRGKLDSSFSAVCLWRLIPAHAGKTSVRSMFAPVAWAHPRACGENVFGDGHTRGGVGSSPRMRGKRMTQASHLSSPGLIPAHAGKT